jgi:PAS domain S-box-containing protein
MTGNTTVGVLSVPENLFQVVADVAPVLVWMSGPDKLCTFFNKGWLDFTGRSIESELGNGWASGVHPDDLQACLDTYSSAFDRRDPFKMEYRLRRHDGEYRWVLDAGVALFSPDGAFAGYIGSCVDITERRNAEDAVRHKEMELREAQRLAGVGSWRWDADTDTVRWSEEFYHLIGRDPQLGAVSSKYHGTLFSAESWIQLQRAAKEILRTGASYELDLEMIRADGTRIWVTARGEVQRDSTERIVGLRGTVQNITDRKERENALALFRSLIDGSNDALEVIDPATLRFLDVNEKACRDLGYSREELLSLTVLDVDAAMDPSAMKTLAAKCRKDFVVFESVHRRKNGSTFPVEVTMRPLTLDRAYNVAVARDITERKRTEEELRDSEERLRLAVEAGKMFAYTWDAATDQILRSGDSYLLGVDAATPFTGRQLLENVHSEDRHLLVSAFDRLTPDTPLFQVSYRMIRPDGEVVWVERNSRAYFDADGRVLRIIGMAADITQRKRGEEALSSISRRLIQAQEAERARIARDLHDDIGQRLALLSMTVEQLTHVRSHTSDEGRSLLDSLQTQSAEISGSVQAIAHELHSSRLQHLGVVAAMKGFCAELSTQQKVEVDFGYADVLPGLPGETALCLFRVLQEALHNAVRHSGVRQFEVQLRGTADALQLTVRDKGLGFDPDNAIDGRGLGLTSMKERLKLVGGELLIKSGSARGTTIVARVPLSSDGVKLLASANLSL